VFEQTGFLLLLLLLQGPSPKYSIQLTFNSPLLRLCLYLIVPHTDSQRHYSADQPTPQAADDMLHCFSLLPEKSTGRIPYKQAHGI
jgi:hypothetical protein